MSKIKVGDIVECVRWDSTPHAIVGKTYVVKGFDKLGTRTVIVVDCEIEKDCKIAHTDDIATTPAEEDIMYHCFRLRRAIDGKSSISIF